MDHTDISCPDRLPTFEDLEVIAAAAAANRDPQPAVWWEARRVAESALAGRPERKAAYRRALDDVRRLFVHLNPQGGDMWPFGRAFDAYVDASLAVITLGLVGDVITDILSWPWVARFGEIPGADCTGTFHHVPLAA